MIRKKSIAEKIVTGHFITCERGHMEYISEIEDIKYEPPNEWKCIQCGGRFKFIRGKE